MSKVRWYVQRNMFGDPLKDYKGHFICTMYLKGKQKRYPFGYSKLREMKRRCQAKERSMTASHTTA